MIIIPELTIILLLLAIVISDYIAVNCVELILHCILHFKYLKVCLFVCWHTSPDTHTHTHTHTYIKIYQCIVNTSNRI